MSLYNNFDGSTIVDVSCEEIESVFETKNARNKVFVFRNIVRLRYEDGSSMVEHQNVFQGLINQSISLDVPLADEVFALFC